MVVRRERRRTATAPRASRCACALLGLVSSWGCLLDPRPEDDPATPIELGGEGPADFSDQGEPATRSAPTPALAEPEAVRPGASAASEGDVPGAERPPTSLEAPDPPDAGADSGVDGGVGAAFSDLADAGTPAVANVQASPPTASPP